MSKTLIFTATYNEKENILNPDFFAYGNIDFVI